MLIPFRTIAFAENTIPEVDSLDVRPPPSDVEWTGGTNVEVWRNRNANPLKNIHIGGEVSPKSQVPGGARATSSWVYPVSLSPTSYYERDTISDRYPYIVQDVSIAPGPSPLESSQLTATVVPTPAPQSANALLPRTHSRMDSLRGMPRTKIDPSFRPRGGSLGGRVPTLSKESAQWASRSPRERSFGGATRSSL